MAASTWPRPGAPNHLRGFFFQRRQGKIDWRKLGRVNLHALVAQITKSRGGRAGCHLTEREEARVNVEVLNDNVDHVTFADITEDGTRLMIFFYNSSRRKDESGLLICQAAKPELNPSLAPALYYVQPCRYIVNER
eukprot:9724-Amorphochlora_amoeboformis.AAC.1